VVGVLAGGVVWLDPLAAASAAGSKAVKNASIVFTFKLPINIFFLDS
jgi:hypothetical protein